MRIKQFEKPFIKDFLVEHEPPIGSVFKVLGGKKLATGAIILETDSFKLYLFPNSAAVSIVWAWFVDHQGQDVSTIVVEITNNHPGYELHTESPHKANVFYNFAGDMVLTPIPNESSSTKAKGKSST